MSTRATMMPLGDLCHVVGGGTPSKDKPHYYNGDIPWATVRDMRSDVIADTECRITSAAVAASATNVIPAGNVVIATRVGLGKVCLVEQATAINQDLRGIIPRDPSLLSVRYLFWWLKSVAPLIEKEGTGATVQGVKLPFIKSLKLPFRSNNEQQRIVAILDESFEGIATVKANAEKNLRNARAVFESYLVEVFSARVGRIQQVRLEDLCEERRAITYGVIKLGDPVDGGVPCLRTSNVRWLDVDTTGMKRIASALSAEYARTILRGGEVLVNVRGTLGGVAVVSDDMVGWNVSREVAVVPVNSGLLDPEYAAFWIGSRTSQDWLSGVKKGTAYTGINIEDLRDLPVPLPALGVQRAIVNDVRAFRDATRRLEALYRNKVAALDNLKIALLRQAFSGELTVNDATGLEEAVA